jgi:predicted GIY-YIG superfamily endonuclease
MSFWMYMLQCADGSYYVGHTDNLDLRISAHVQGSIPGCYTESRRPGSLVFSQYFASRYEALALERRVKGWSRAKKEALIREDWGEISRLAKCEKSVGKAE